MGQTLTQENIDFCLSLENYTVLVYNTTCVTPNLQQWSLYVPSSVYAEDTLTGVKTLMSIPLSFNCIILSRSPATAASITFHSSSDYEIHTHYTKI